MRYQLGFIGCGNMGGALVAAAAKTIPPSQIAVCDFDKTKVENLQKTLGVTGASAEELAKDARFLVLGVKPQVMEQTLAPIAEILKGREDITVVTMAAGLSISAIRAFIGKDLPVIRIMPNTPVRLGAGMVLFTCQGVCEDAKAAFLNAFSQAGKFDELAEEKIDAGSAVSGCGPAFVYAFAKALAQGGVECGLSKEQAEFYAAQTLLGGAEMLLQFGDPDALIKAVCSPNGTTLAGMAALEAKEFENVAKSSVLAAYKRTLELKK